MSDSSESSHSLTHLTEDDEYVFDSQHSSDSDEQTPIYYGIPTHCWCGEPTVLLTSKTELNPFRRFYRCAKAARLKLRNDKHVFKWLDEGLHNELKKMEEKVRSLEGELGNLKLFLEELIKQDERNDEVRENHINSQVHELKISMIFFSLFAFLMACLITGMYGY